MLLGTISETTCGNQESGSINFFCGACISVILYWGLSVVAERLLFFYAYFMKAVSHLEC